MLGGFLFLWSVRYRTEPGMSDGCLIGPDGFLKQRYIKEWELYHPRCRLSCWAICAATATTLRGTLCGPES